MPEWHALAIPVFMSILGGDQATLQRKSGWGPVSWPFVSLLGSLSGRASFLNFAQSALKLSPACPCYGRACPQEEACSAEVPILKMADRVHRFRCSLQHELTFPQEFSGHHFLHALNHPLPFLRLFTPIDGQTYRTALAMAPLCQYFPSPW